MGTHLCDIIYKIISEGAKASRADQPTLLIDDIKDAFG